MLWYKAWRESRARFLLSAAALAVICVCFVCFPVDANGGISDQSLTYLVYIWRVTYKGYLRELFMILAILLGLGGLMRERDHRTATFTLGLPVRRWQLLATRTAVGLVEIVLLAMLPALVLPALSRLLGQAYPTSQAWAFALLWATVGTLIFALGLLASVLFTGEFTAPVVAFLSLVGYSFLANMPAIRRYLTDIHDVMSGVPSFKESTGLLTGPLPWATMLAVLLATATLIGIGAGVTNRQDF
jgi:ABC-2 type transport system permease protein